MLEEFAPTWLNYATDGSELAAGSKRKHREYLSHLSQAFFWKYPLTGGYERQLPQEQTANPSNVYLLIINLNFRYSNDSRLLPVDTRAVLLLSVIFMRLMAETTCDE